jgi:hypothetical protein
VKRALILALAAAMAIAVPATAKTPPSHPAKSHRCAAYKVSYRASGTLTTWSLTKGANGTYSGTLTVDVTRANHHARDAKGTSVTYTVTNARVRFGRGVTDPPAAGDHVKLIGRITEVAKKCSDHSAAGVVTLRRIEVSAAHK